MKLCIYTSAVLGLLVLPRLDSALRASKCSEGFLPCDDGSCVRREQWCDLNDDCGDTSDEIYCSKIAYFTGSDPNGCKPFHFRCGNGICFPGTIKCDGVKDCKDGSDENYCVPGLLEEFSSEIRSVSSNVSTAANRSPEHVSLPSPLPYRRAGVSEAPRRSFEPRRPSPRPAGTTDPQRVLGTIEALAKGERWILDLRSSDWGWGKDSARALIALGLANHYRFSTYNKDDALMKIQLQILMAIDLLRNDTQAVSLSKLSLYINAMLATCQDPWNFHGMDLVQELRDRTTQAQSKMPEGVFVNPIAYLTLCNANQTENNDVHMLRTLLNPKSREQKWLDMQSLSIMALACIVRTPRFSNYAYKQLLDGAMSKLASRMAPDGSFGNVYSSALAIQALIASNAHSYWNNEPSLTFLKRHQLPSGSFGDVLSTYYVLPALASSSLINLRKVTCNNTRGGPNLISMEYLQNSKVVKHYIRYSLHLGNPVEVSYAIVLHVPVNMTFFNIMRLAQKMDPKFRFLYEHEGEDVTVYSISNVPNDAEKGIYWNLYLYSKSQPIDTTNPQVQSLKHHNKGIQNLIPGPGQHVMFWYHPI